MKIFIRLCATLFILLFSQAHAKLPQIDSKGTQRKINEIMKMHAVHKELSSPVVKRALSNYLELLDPTKTYLTEEEVNIWVNPTDELTESILKEYKYCNYETFEKIHDLMARAILKRRLEEKQTDYSKLPKDVKADEFKDIEWAKSREDLIERRLRIRALQIEAANKLEDDLRETSIQRIQKRQTKNEEKILNTDDTQKHQFIYANILKATSSALDAHTYYFTPDEATQFMISVQQRLFGIGAQLRDDLNGFTIVKIIDGGPAQQGKELKVKDRIIAVNGEPVVGMEIIDAVELIRGEEGTEVTLTVIRQTEQEEVKKEEKLEINIVRGEVVLKETRYEVDTEPFGDGVIAYFKLNSFYQDPEFSSAADLKREINKIKDEHKLKGVLLDLRSNSGGLLTQAVNVSGLFISKGIVASIRDENGRIQHLRDLDGKTIWDGPLVILINKASASASEIVAQALQDYGRAIIIGDDHSYGKGTFQTFTLNANNTNDVDPEGEFKVTRGVYYTVSGKTPQQVGVQSDIVIPGAFSEVEIGEQYLKHPLENNRIDPNFDDQLLDMPSNQRESFGHIYRYNMQQKLNVFTRHIPQLKSNSEIRLANNKNYQAFLNEIKKSSDRDVEDEEADNYGKNDLQLQEGYNVLKDLIFLMN